MNKIEFVITKKRRSTLRPYFEMMRNLRTLRVAADGVLFDAVSVRENLPLLAQGFEQRVNVNLTLF